MFRKLNGLFLGLAFCGWTGTASATLIGDTVTIGGLLNNSQTVAVVGAGIEHTYVFSSTRTWEFDVGASTLSVLFTGSQETDLAEHWIASFSGLDWVNDPSGEIVGFDLDVIGDIFFGSSNSPGITNSDVTFDAHSVLVDLNDTWQWNTGDGFTISLITSHDVPVPVPATVTLFGIGLAGLGWSRRKQHPWNLEPAV